MAATANRHLLSGIGSALVTSLLVWHVEQLLYVGLVDFGWGLLGQGPVKLVDKGGLSGFGLGDAFQANAAASPLN
jgi:hypothetical protein